MPPKGKAVGGTSGAGEQHLPATAAGGDSLASDDTSIATADGKASLKRKNSDLIDVPNTKLLKLLKQSDPELPREGPTPTEPPLKDLSPIEPPLEGLSMDMSDPAPVPPPSGGPPEPLSEAPEAVTSMDQSELSLERN